MTTSRHTARTALDRIADALDRLAPSPPAPPDFSAPGFLFETGPARLRAVAAIPHQPLALLRGADRQIAVLMDNTQRFAAGAMANNALLWGARGVGKSASVKAVHAAIAADHPTLKLVEIHRDDLTAMADLLRLLRDRPERFVLFCDDLSFDAGDGAYKSLKAVLEGGIEGRPENVLLYATSNRRHLMPRAMIENEQSTAIHAGEAVEEAVSLSDRFGLWLGFHGIDQNIYLEIVEGYAAVHAIPLGGEALRQAALAWAVTRGARSGRIAWQFIQSLAPG